MVYNLEEKPMDTISQAFWSNRQANDEMLSLEAAVAELKDWALLRDCLEVPWISRDFYYGRLGFVTGVTYLRLHWQSTNLRL